MHELPVMNNSTMKTIDDSNLLRALLLLIRADNGIWEHEKNIFTQVGKELGFDKEFCDAAIQNVLRNQYIDNTPPVFFFKENAVKFLRIALRIISDDSQPHMQKIELIEKITSANHLPGYIELEGFKNVAFLRQSGTLAAYKNNW